MSSGFRYLIPEPIFDELVQYAKDDAEKLKNGEDRITQGWIFADRKENFAIVTNYMVSDEDSHFHVKPKSWMKMKRSKIFTMRNLKAERNVDIVWQFHTHPDGNEELHDTDLKILGYLSTGVMIIITPSNILGWYYDKRESKKAIIDKMVFEVISE